MREDILHFYMREYIYDYYITGIGNKKVAEWMTRMIEKDF